MFKSFGHPHRVLSPAAETAASPAIKVTLVVVARDAHQAEPWPNFVHQIYGPAPMGVEVVLGFDATRERLKELWSEGVIVPLVLVLSEASQATDEGGWAEGRKSLLDAVSAQGADVLAVGAGDNPIDCAAGIKRAVSAFLLARHPEVVAQKPSLVTHAALHAALRDAQAARQHLHVQLQDIQSAALMAGHEPTGALASKLHVGQRVEAWLELKGKDHQIEAHPPGALILSEHKINDSVWFVLEGEVEQEKASRSEPGARVVIMNQGPGEIVGILSLLSHAPAFATIRSRTAVRLARMSRDDLAALLSDDPQFLAAFLHALLSLLHTRIVTVSETKVALQESLDALRSMQIKLVESEKMASMGMLTAGVAHELNNPAAALSRAADHVASALTQVVADLCAEGPSAGVLRARGPYALHLGGLTPPSTAAIRERVSRGPWPKDWGSQSLRQAAEMQLAAEAASQNDATHGLAEPEVQSLFRFFEVGRYLNNIHSCSQRITALVQGMRNYASAESDVFVVTDVRTSIGDTVTMLQNRLKRYDFESSYEKLLDGQIQAVPSRLNQVWTNLVVNACDATEPGKQILIHARNGQFDDGAPCVEVLVVDEGVGIPSDVAPHIFEPRFTTKKRQTNQTGLGLGLAIVKKIVSDHGGVLDFVSPPPPSPAWGCETPGRRGTVFRVRLPLASWSQQGQGLKKENP
jgi:signal transduction histidine kinase